MGSNGNETAACPPRVCDVGGSGLLLPIFGDAEQRWSNKVRVVLYMAGLCWTFMGVAIVADVFMTSIERITSQKRRVFVTKLQRHVTVMVWNDTVANLTLMALGSSAPEILLSLVELLGGDFYAGELGPATIVGSAAFNLFCILAVCVASVPMGEVRIIKNLGVYTMTAGFSLFAYFWLYMIVAFSSEDIIEIWEAFLTLLFFPVLVVLAFVADKGIFSSNHCAEAESSCVAFADVTPQEIAKMEMMVQQEHDGKLTDEQVALIVQKRLSTESRSRAHYRVGATRSLVGGSHVSHACSEHIEFSKVVPIEEPVDDKHFEKSTTVTIGFTAKKFVVSENIGTLQISVEMHIIGELSEMSEVVGVHYRTREGTAKATADYEHIDGVLEFYPGDSFQKINVKIMNDDAFEDEEEFYIDLFDPYTEQPDCEAIVGDCAMATVCIVDDDRPGTIAFKMESTKVHEDLVDKEVPIGITRNGGCVGKISVQYRTEDASALAGRDYVAIKGTLEFASGQATAELTVTIKPRGRYEDDEFFRVILWDPTGGARLDKNTDGGESQKIMSVFVVGSAEKKDTVDRLISKLQLNWDRAQIGHSNWKDQFVAALYVNGGNEEDDDLAEQRDEPGRLTWCLHIITLPWKILFAFIPPVDFCNGWLCFVCSLIMIGLVTALIGDLASLLGCTMGLPDAITAITFVALGTSLPDTFASQTAAIQDPCADASVGNVTGSNSVNVFLGIGLSWTVGSIYWSNKGFSQEWASRYPSVSERYPQGGKFVVRGASELGFSVLIFFLFAMAAITTLAVRRVKCGGELGGPRIQRYVTIAFFTVLWLSYVALSSWRCLTSLSSKTCT
eukprot:TRINITY_DN7137_c2_g3_i1.p1 TRINITY_DN7137_c2_g3~~TRINITY_DN7137_c2_g3_i1.p1  ORF type:complete len:844 (-),score=168.77 TRINITY_DN7137_c2_g3_i1:38-2569(-)